MPDRSDVDRIVAANRYLVLATVDAEARPWATPVFFAPLDGDLLCWASSPRSRHSRNIAARPAIAATVFDSTVAVGGAEAAYFEVEAARADAGGINAALEALNSRLPDGRQLAGEDVRLDGPMVLYRARILRRFVLVRGGQQDQEDALDMTLEV